MKRIKNLKPEEVVPFYFRILAYNEKLKSEGQLFKPAELITAGYKPTTLISAMEVERFVYYELQNGEYRRVVCRNAEIHFFTDFNESSGFIDFGLSLIINVRRDLKDLPLVFPITKSLTEKQKAATIIDYKTKVIKRIADDWVEIDFSPSDILNEIGIMCRGEIRRLNCLIKNPLQRIVKQKNLSS